MVSAKAETGGHAIKELQDDAEVAQESSPVAPPSHQIETLIREYFPECPDVAIAVARAESNLEAHRVGDKHLAWDDGRNGMSCGLMQIRVFPDRPSCDELLDPVENIKYARKLYEKSGWQPWSTFNSGRYKLFMQ